MPHHLESIPVQREISKTTNINNKIFKKNLYALPRRFLATQLQPLSDSGQELTRAGEGVSSGPKGESDTGGCGLGHCPRAGRPGEEVQRSARRVGADRHEG